MSDLKYTTLLESIDPRDLINLQKRNGRQSLTPEEMRYWQGVNESAHEMFLDNRRSIQVRKNAEFLYLITQSISELITAPTPKYYTYTEVRLLDWYIGMERNTYRHYKEKIIRGIYYLLSDFLKFEAESMAGIEPYTQDNMDNIDLPDRINKLKDVFAHTKQLHKEVFGTPLKDDYVHYDGRSNLNDYTSEKEKLCGLIDFTCFPRTTHHDEYAFLRTIHVSELCFLGIIVTIKEAIDNIKANYFDQATRLLNHANGFAHILHGGFKVLRTMPAKPKNNFELFREETGHASAVQSKNYQEMDITLRGIDNNRKMVYDENKYLKYLQKYAHPNFGYNLKAVLSKYREEDHPALFETARELDKKLITWKGLHLGFAHAYLPKNSQGTGSTSGADYLQLFFRASVFDETQIDYGLFADRFSIEEFPEIHQWLTRVDSRIQISVPGRKSKY